MNKNSEQNFELNLLPVISVLAVCISFLLATTVWLPLGSLDIKQSMGENSEQTTKPTRIEITLIDNNKYIISVEVEGKKVKELKVTDPSENKSEFQKHLDSIKKNHPNIELAFISPQKQSKYKNVIAVLDVLNKNEIKEIGVLPAL
jgi:biopolymer transport protein ExbD